MQNAGIRPGALIMRFARGFQSGRARSPTARPDVLFLAFKYPRRRHAATGGVHGPETATRVCAKA
jgi:hypothetical protein